MNVPKLRFKGFSGEWHSFMLGDIATFYKGKNLSKADIVEGGINPCIRYGELYTVYGEAITEIVSYTNVPLNESFLSIANDVIIPASGETQVDIAKASCVMLDDIILGGDLNVVRLKENGLFISYYLNSKKKFEIAKLAQGNAVVHLYASQLKQLFLKIPSIQEQTKIASFLTAVDEKIAQLTQKHELLSQYKKGVMQQIFSQQLRFKDDNGEEFGEWEEKIFSHIYTFIGTNSLSRENLNYENGAIKNIHYGDIHTKFKSNFILNNENVPYINIGVDVRKFTEENYLIEKDLVIADASEDYNDIGKCIEVVSVDGKKVVAGLHTYIARPTADLVLGFGGYMMQSFKIRSQIKKLATGVSVLGISKTNISKVKLDLPSKLEQAKIANFLSSIDQKIDQAAAQLDAAKQYKRGLLQQMFV